MSETKKKKNNKKGGRKNQEIQECLRVQKIQKSDLGDGESFKRKSQD